MSQSIENPSSLAKMLGRDHMTIPAEAKGPRGAHVIFEGIKPLKGAVSHLTA